MQVDLEALGNHIRADRTVVVHKAAGRIAAGCVAVVRMVAVRKVVAAEDIHAAEIVVAVVDIHPGSRHEGLDATVRYESLFNKVSEEKPSRRLETNLSASFLPSFHHHPRALSFSS